MWETISKILNVILGLSTIYLYIETRKLKSFEFEKEISLAKIEKDDLKAWYEKRKSEIDSDMAKRNLILSGIRTQQHNALKEEYKRKRGRIDARLQYFEKLKRYKWIFSR